MGVGVGHFLPCHSPQTTRHRSIVNVAVLLICQVAWTILEKYVMYYVRSTYYSDRWFLAYIMRSWFYLSTRFSRCVALFFVIQTSLLPSNTEESLCQEPQFIFWWFLDLGIAHVNMNHVNIWPCIRVYQNNVKTICFRCYLVKFGARRCFAKNMQLDYGVQ